MNFRRKTVSIFSVGLISLSSFFFSVHPAEALKPFGGLTLTQIGCMNLSQYVVIGPPSGGSYVWSPATRTYLLGPPSPGRWNLGIAGPPDVCIVSITPPVFFFGLTMITLGTSGGAGSLISI